MNKKVMAGKPLAWILLVSIALIWGTSFILIKKSLQVFTPGELGALRITMAFLALMPVAVRAIPKLPTSKLPILFILGMNGSFIPAFLFAIAQTRLESSITGVINAITPIFVIVIGVLFFRHKVKWINTVGILLGFSGTVILLLGASGFDISGINYYAFFVVLATVLYGTNINLIKQYTPDIRALHITAVSLFMTSPFCFVYLFGFTDLVQKISLEPDFITAFFYISVLGVIGTAGALVLFNRLIQVSSPVFASSVTYLIPLVALMWGIWDGENINLYQFIGMAIVLSGVWLANRR
ncbi:MAG: DMT family transporter [Cyclobacteriaceae bacterium]